jgi:hypothetical protein
MKTTVVCCAALALVAGCAVVPPQAWTFDPALPPAKAALPVQEFAALTGRFAELRLRRDEIRARIATQPDARQRQQLYEQLHAVGMQLSPLERRLATVASSR